MLEHPLFQAAKDRYARSTLTCDHVAEWMLAAGLDVKVSSERFTLRMATDRWATMVAARYMSLLARYSDNELAAGITEIRQRHGDMVQFDDTYNFIEGVNSAAS